MLELISKQAALEIAMCYCPDDDGNCSKAGHDIREMLDEIESLSTIELEQCLKERIAEILRRNLNNIYCGDCRGNEEDVEESFCYGCHRKNINWELGNGADKCIAEEVIKTINEIIGRRATTDYYAE